jgi:hypothetical protein
VVWQQVAQVVVVLEQITMPQVLQAVAVALMVQDLLVTHFLLAVQLLAAQVDQDFTALVQEVLEEAETKILLLQQQRLD